MSDIPASLRQRAEAARGEAARLDARMNRVSFARLVMTAAMLVFGALAVTEPRYRSAFGAGAALAAVAFVLLVRATQRLDGDRRVALARAKVNEQGALRAERAWSQIDPQPWT